MHVKCQLFQNDFLRWNVNITERLETCKIEMMKKRSLDGRSCLRYFFRATCLHQAVNQVHDNREEPGTLPWRPKNYGYMYAQRIKTAGFIREIENKSSTKTSPPFQTLHVVT